MKIHYQPRKTLFSVFAVALLCGFVTLGVTRLGASPPPPPKLPIKLYEIGTGNAACGPNYRIRLKFTYDGVVIADKTFDNGQKMDLGQSSQSFNAGKKMKAEVFLLTKATGAVWRQGSWEGTQNFNGSTGWTVSASYYSEPPYFRWMCRQAQELYGAWYVGFEGEQRPP